MIGLVDVDMEAGGAIDLAARFADNANDLLQGFDIGVIQDRRDQLTFAIVRAVHRCIAHDLPFTALIVRGRISVIREREFGSRPIHRNRDRFTSSGTSDSVKFDFDTEVLFFDHIVSSHFRIPLDFRFFVFPLTCVHHNSCGLSKQVKNFTMCSCNEE